MGQSPIWLRCPKCNSFDGRFTGKVDDAHRDIVATGKVKPLTERGRRGSRNAGARYQVHHVRCGHTWWSTHYDARDYYNALPDEQKESL